MQVSREERYELRRNVDLLPPPAFITPIHIERLYRMACMVPYLCDDVDKLSGEDSTEKEEEKG